MHARTHAVTQSRTRTRTHTHTLTDGNGRKHDEPANAHTTGHGSRDRNMLRLMYDPSHMYEHTQYVQQVHRSYSHVDCPLEMYPHHTPFECPMIDLLYTVHFQHIRLSYVQSTHTACMHAGAWACWSYHAWRNMIGIQAPAGCTCNIFSLQPISPDQHGLCSIRTQHASKLHTG